MKHNIAFVLLTAAVLALGFYGIDIYEHFCGNSISEISYIERYKENNNAVYLSITNEEIEPFSLIEPYRFSEKAADSYEARELLSCMIKSLARQSSKTYIFQPAGQELENAWRFSKNGYIYTEKWEYLNSAREVRYLDCIVCSRDLSISYIRFYSGDEKSISANEMNDGLAQLNKMSIMFYPKIQEYISSFNNTKYEFMEYYDNCYGLSYDEQEAADYFLNTYIYSSEWKKGNMLLDFVHKYEISRDITELYSPYEADVLSRYWISQLAFLDIYTSAGNPITAGNKISQLYSDHSGEWQRPSYTAEKCVIFQTMRMGSEKLVVMYNVKEKMIEGFYFPRNNLYKLNSGMLIGDFEIPTEN